MTKKMIWAEIKKLYDQEWVELVDCDWPLSRASILTAESWSMAQPVYTATVVSTHS